MDRAASPTDNRSVRVNGKNGIEMRIREFHSFLPEFCRFGAFFTAKFPIDRQKTGKILRFLQSCDNLAQRPSLAAAARSP
jgi:hypothetical protein